MFRLFLAMPEMEARAAMAALEQVAELAGYLEVLLVLAER